MPQNEQQSPAVQVAAEDVALGGFRFYTPRMKMPIVAIVCGLALDLLATVGFLISHTKSVTVWIPAFIGLPLLVAGIVALNPARLKTAMHIAATFALLGFLAAGGRLAGVMAKGGFAWTTGTISQAIMAFICLLFVVLAIQSFIAARKAKNLAVKL